MKKYSIINILLLILLVSGITSCQKNKSEIDLNVNPVTNLMSPATNVSIDLDLVTQQKFEWQPTKAADGSLVLYEVYFDKETGDFSKPVYTVVSDGKGVQNTLTLTNTQLDDIAALAGATPLSTVKLKWTVAASKGWNIVPSTENRLLQVKRSSPIPQTLSFAGSGTEGASTPLKMKMLSRGVFEIFTKLKTGDAKFIDEKNAEYSLKLNGATYLIASGAAPTGLTGTNEMVVWIRINFGAKTGTITQVKQMELWYCNDNAPAIVLPYTAKGVWRKDNVADFMKPAGWTSREERYKYRMLINDGSGDKYYWINSFMGDPGGQDGAYPSSLEYRSVNLDKNDGSQWDWGWKFDRNYLTVGNFADYWITMNADVEKYNQEYKKW